MSNSFTPAPIPSSEDMAMRLNNIEHANFIFPKMSSTWGGFGIYGVGEDYVGFGARKRLWVNDGYTKITDKTTNMWCGMRLLNSDGLFPWGGSGLQPNTNYFSYLSGPNVNYIYPLYSLEPPSSEFFPYLGGGENQSNWRLVGCSRTGSSSYQSENYHGAGFYNYPELVASNCTISGAIATDHTVASIPNIIALPYSRLRVRVRGTATCTSGGANLVTMKLVINSSTKATQEIMVSNTAPYIGNFDFEYSWQADTDWSVPYDYSVSLMTQYTADPTSVTFSRSNIELHRSF